MADTPRLPEGGEELARASARTLDRLLKVLARVGLHTPPPSVGAAALEAAIEEAYYALPFRTSPPEHIRAALASALHTWFCVVDMMAAYLREPKERRYRMIMEELASLEILLDVAVRGLDALN
mgnify:CR=1 FL=1